MARDTTKSTTDDEGIAGSPDPATDTGEPTTSTSDTDASTTEGQAVATEPASTTEPTPTAETPEPAPGDQPESVSTTEQPAADPQRVIIEQAPDEPAVFYGDGGVQAPISGEHVAAKYEPFDW